MFQKENRIKMLSLSNKLTLRYIDDLLLYNWKNLNFMTQDGLEDTKRHDQIHYILNFDLFLNVTLNDRTNMVRDRLIVHRISI